MDKAHEYIQEGFLGLCFPPFALDALKHLSDGPPQCLSQALHNSQPQVLVLESRTKKRLRKKLINLKWGAQSNWRARRSCPRKRQWRRSSWSPAYTASKIQVRLAKEQVSRSAWSGELSREWWVRRYPRRNNALLKVPWDS